MFNLIGSLRSVAPLWIYYIRELLKLILKEGFLGVPKSEKPECTRRTRGFRRRGQRQKHPLQSIYIMFSILVVA